MVTTGSPPAQRLAGPGGALLAGTLLSNLLSYAFFVVLSRHLSGADLGAVGALVNLSVIASVAGLGLQLVAARLVAHAAEASASDRLDRQILWNATGLGIAVAAVVALGSPLLSTLLHVPLAAVIILAASLAPMTLTFACQGVLQGRERFVTLAVVLALAGVAKLGAAVAAALTALSVTGVVGALTAGWFLVAFVALWAARAWPQRDTAVRPGHLWRLVAAAVVPTSGLLFLSSVDVLLARQHLTPAQSGAYTIGALFEKAAFWGMTFLATLFYPAMAVAHRRRDALTRALGITGAVGLAGVLVAALFGAQLATLVGGASYAALGPDLWRFTAYGVCLALVQVLAYAGLATASAPMGRAIWLVNIMAVALVTALPATRSSVSALVTTLALCATALVLVGLYLERSTLGPVSGPRRARSDRHPR
ncbi:hypothetical protein GCM10027053_37880 [Intrasporangium mesophilum]